MTKEKDFEDYKLEMINKLHADLFTMVEKYRPFMSPLEYCGIVFENTIVLAMSQNMPNQAIVSTMKLAARSAIQWNKENSEEGAKKQTEVTNGE